MLQAKALDEGPEILGHPEDGLVATGLQGQAKGGIGLGVAAAAQGEEEEAHGAIVLPLGGAWKAQIFSDKTEKTSK
jgi:hypothetical protein